MQISLTQHSDRLIERMMALGYGDPSAVIEAALERMVAVELSGDESEEMLFWLRQEVAIGAEQVDRGEFSELSLDEIKAQVLADHQRRLV
jgi:Arc/MetJ-type ribon-helix-helix transcriptional regulator